MSSVGRHPTPAGNLARPEARCGSGFTTAAGASGAPPNRTPVTCWTIYRKLAGSAVMNVVCERFEARDFLLEIFPEGGGAARRRGADS